jgi:hypothetical protein
LLRRFAIWLLRDELRARRAAAYSFSQAEWRGQGNANKRGRVFWNGYDRALASLEQGTDL